MTFNRVNGGGWALYEVLSSAQMNALDINMSRALDGYAGGDYSPSSDLKVYGKILGEDEDYRSFRYPLSCALAEDWSDWSYTMNGASHLFTASSTPNVRIMFSLNRFLHNGVQLRDILPYVKPASGEASMADRILSELWVVENDGTASLKYSSYYRSSGTTAYPIPILSGVHDGGDGQSILTDSVRAWSVNDLVGYTIYNITDGSNGIITTNTSNTVTATLSGGTDNDWDDDDFYIIKLNYLLDTETYMYNLVITSANNAGLDEIYSVEVEYIEVDYLDPP